jgi:hypothetical protein
MGTVDNNDDDDGGGDNNIPKVHLPVINHK